MNSLNWIAILLLVGAAHALLLAATLLTIRRGNRLANRMVAFIFMVFAITICFHTIATTDFLLRYPQLSKIEPPLAFLLGPFFYFYVRALTHGSFRLRRKHLLHFVPALLCIVGLLPYYLQPVENKIQHILNDHQGSCMHCFLIYFGISMQLLTYIGLIAKVLVDYKKRIRDSYSSLEKINLNWLRNLLLGVFITWVASFAMQFVSPTIDTGSYIWLLVSIQFYLMGYFGLRHPEVFVGMEDGWSKPQKKYEKSTLTPERADEYLKKLKTFMESEKPHLESDITLPALSKRLAISIHHLSQIVNDKLQQNFFEFVNSSRVEEAKKKIDDPANQNLNLAEIGFDVGFNSISSFNAAFKKHSGTTPSQYRERSLLSENAD